MDLTVSTPGRRRAAAASAVVLALAVFALLAALGAAQHMPADYGIGIIPAVLLVPFAVVVLRTSVRLDGTVLTSRQAVAVSVDLQTAEAVTLHRTPSGIVSLHVTAGGHTARAPMLGSKSGQMLDAAQLTALRGAVAAAPDGSGEDAVAALDLQLAAVRAGARPRDTPFGRYADSRRYDAVADLSALAALTELMR